MTILLPLAVSCPRQIPALPMVLVHPAQKWLFVPALYLPSVFPLPTEPRSLCLKGQGVMEMATRLQKYLLKSNSL